MKIIDFKGDGLQTNESEKSYENVFCDIKIKVIHKKNPYKKGFNKYARITHHLKKDGEFSLECVNEIIDMVKWDICVYGSDYELGTPEEYMRLQDDMNLDEGWYRPVLRTTQGYFDLYPETEISSLEPIKKKKSS